jgi:hypothetical protein
LFVNIVAPYLTSPSHRTPKVIVHNAGQYVGIMADNVEGLTGDKLLMFGDGSLLEHDGKNKL